MAIVEDPVPPTPVLPTSSLPVVAKEPYSSVTVDTKVIPSSALLTHVEGSRWTVDYYSQILTNDSALAGEMVNRNPIYQQYRLIQRLELRVTSPLNTSQDTATKSLNITGTANLYGFIMPNEGDMFIANIGDGKEGIFRILMSERKTIFKDTIHVIEYKLIDYVTPERKSDLTSKVVDTFVFSKDFLTYGQNPLIRYEDNILIEKLTDYYYSLAKRYFDTFISNEYKTLLVPGQDRPIYDHFLTKFVMSSFTAYDINMVRNIRLMNLDDDYVMKSTTIWDMLKDKDVSMFKYCIKKAGLISARSFTKDPMMEGIYHSGIQYVLYPKDYTILPVDYQVSHAAKPLSGEVLQDPPSPITNLADLIVDTEYQGLTLPANPGIRKVLVDDYYVFSSYFYNKDKANMSILELLVFDYLDGKAIDNRLLFSLCETSHAWGALERFYYSIIILILIRSSIKSI
jgi:hypothetical protein